MKEPDPSLSCVLCVEHFKFATQVLDWDVCYSSIPQKSLPNKNSQHDNPFKILVVEKPNVETFSYSACAFVKKDVLPEAKNLGSILCLKAITTSLDFSVGCPLEQNRFYTNK